MLSRKKSIYKGEEVRGNLALFFGSDGKDHFMKHESHTVWIESRRQRRALECLRRIVVEKSLQSW